MAQSVPSLPVCGDVPVNRINKEPPNVVTVDGLKDLLDKGWELCIHCDAEPELRGPQWHGRWYFFGIDPRSPANWAALVTTRALRKAGSSSEKSTVAEYTFREIRTLTTVTTLCKELGFTISAAPIIKGKSIIVDGKSNS